MRVAVKHFLALCLFAAIVMQAAACGHDRCNWKETKKTCHHLANYQCFSSKSFCLGGHIMRCADGTWCKDSAGPWITPCSLTRPPRKHRKQMHKKRWGHKKYHH